MGKPSIGQEPAELSTSPALPPWPLFAVSASSLAPCCLSIEQRRRGERGARASVGVGMFHVRTGFGVPGGSCAVGRNVVPPCCLGILVPITSLAPTTLQSQHPRPPASQSCGPCRADQPQHVDGAIVVDGAVDVGEPEAGKRELESQTGKARYFFLAPQHAPDGQGTTHHVPDRRTRPPPYKLLPCIYRLSAIITHPSSPHRSA